MPTVSGPSERSVALPNVTLPFMELYRVFERLDKVRTATGISDPQLFVSDNHDEGHLRGNHDHMPIPADNMSVSGISPNQEEITLSLHDDAIAPILRSLVPRSCIEQSGSGSSRPSNVPGTLSPGYLKLLSYVATNNLAGVEGQVTPLAMYHFLQPIISTMLDIHARSLVNTTLFEVLPSTKPMAELYFRGAIEAGDARGVEQLCHYAEFGIDANTQICVIKGTRCTPIERSAQLRHLELTMALVELGADVHKTYAELHPFDEYHDDKDDYECNEPRGAVEYAIQLHPSRPISLELLETLLRVGGTARTSSIIPLLSPEHADVVQILVASQVRTCHDTWFKKGLFHRLFRFMVQDTILEVISQIPATSADFNYEVGQKFEMSRPNDVVWDIPSLPTHIVDVSAERGDIRTVKALLHFGARLTCDSLTAALRSGNVELVHLLLISGANPDGYSPHFRSTPYAEAIRMRHPELQRLLESRGCLDSIAEEYRFCVTLAVASETGHAAMVEGLLRLKADCHQRVLGYALIQAIRSDHTAVALRLLNAGASTDNTECYSVLGFHGNDRTMKLGFDLKTVKGIPPLTSAIINRNRTLFLALLEHDAWPNGRYSKDDYANILAQAVRWGDHAVLLELMRTSPPWKCRLDLAEIAADEGCVTCVKILADNGYPVYTTLNKGLAGKSALRTAVRSHDIDMVRLLLELGANTADPGALISSLETSPPAFELVMEAYPKQHRCGNSQLTPVINAAIKLERADIVQKMLDQKMIGSVTTGYPSASVEHEDREMAVNPLVFAMRKDGGRDLTMVQTLLRSGVNLESVINWRDGDTTCGSATPNETPLLVAIGTGQRPMVQVLLNAGAAQHVNQEAVRGIKRTPLQRAVELGSIPMLELLLGYGADVNSPAAVRGGATALQLAAIGGYIGILELLLDHGADIDAPPSKVYGRTPIEGAAENGRFDMVKYLAKLHHPPASELEKALSLAKENGHSSVVGVIEELLQMPEPPAPVATTPTIADIFDDALETPDDAHQDDNALGPLQHSCRICQIPLSNASARARHERLRHGGQVDRMKFACGICGRGFARKDMKERHQTTHDKSASVQCPHCHQRKSRKDYLKAHLPICPRRPGIR
ncbi:hypothetical protein LTR37_011570 [Vermiconidia calcicola]|uniref:Uncharacterized protein n=1 Tax=Vermiconidia calcicola TaxID=1690605 RepID=A0ACC3N280_9PEZI|nr:hypothetical protein LTR37_011570 [Vermiconidia calcicola]